MISVIVPTYNERNNILDLIRQIEEVFSGAAVPDFEIIVMDDDSPDGTASLVLESGDSRVRVVNRKDKVRGLSAAVIDGFKEATGDIIGVMDADLSHPPVLLPRLVGAVREGYNLAVGSRYVPGGGIRDWPFKRVLVSKVACWLARPVTSVKDPTSGFFFLKRAILENVPLNPLGFKIGLEVFVKSRHENKIKEVPYVFTDRKKGVSKFNLQIIVCYLQQLFYLATRPRK